METIEVKEKFIELRAKGYSFDKIAIQLKKSKQTLIDWSNEYKEEIANTKAMELEALQEKYYLLKEQRIKAFGELLKKIKTEIDKRDLKDIPTEKLYDLYAKYYLLAKEEIVEPVIKSSQEMTEEKIDRKFIEELTALKSI